MIKNHAHTDNHHAHHCALHDYQPTDIAQRLADAEAQCESAGARFTPLRRDVYRLILSATHPIGAYELISALEAVRRDAGDYSKVAPPTIYRSLEFLLAQGLIHQLNSINAYVPCCHPRAEHAAAFFICQRCHKVQESSNPPVEALLAFSREQANFLVQQSIIELKGLCHDCQ